ncbi:MAG TPA: hypothetical protein VEA41_12440 [Salinarimonas sp.]|nr:hypothetical protein [Salinarimonas sp.]
MNPVRRTSRHTGDEDTASVRTVSTRRELPAQAIPVKENHPEIATPRMRRRRSVAGDDMPLKRNWGRRIHLESAWVADIRQRLRESPDLDQRRVAELAGADPTQISRGLSERIMGIDLARAVARILGADPPFDFEGEWEALGQELLALDDTGELAKGQLMALRTLIRLQRSAKK